MIRAVDYEQVVKTLAAFLDENSGLSTERILNADSIRGTELAEMISSTQSYSPTAKNSFLLFELIENQNQEMNFLTSGSTSESMMSIQAYDFHLMVYGNSSPTDAQKISLLFKQEDNAIDLREKGIFINGVAPIEAINEFVNNTLYLRRDIFVHLQVRYQFDEIGKDPGYFEESGDLTVEQVSLLAKG